MTAHDLIDSIFQRPPWRGMEGNTRRITRAQLDYLRNLIDADPEGGAVTRGVLLGSTVWMPSGRHKYVLVEDLYGGNHTLERLSNIRPSEVGRLF